jgi:hypothetical protein
MAEIELTKGQTALIDDADLERVSQYRWHAGEALSRSGGQLGWYAKSRVNGRTAYLHRFIMEVGPGQLVDHINGNRLDNRRANLRLCTPAQNAMNSDQRVGKSGYRGVQPFKGRYRVVLQAGGVIHRVGHYDTPEEGARAYDAAAERLHGPFARLNFGPANDTAESEAA